MSLVVYTAPAAEPLSSAEVKTYLRVDTGITSDDTYIAALITAAREHAERVTRRALITQTLDLRLDEFPDYEIELPRSPVVSVTSITYIDTTGATQTLSESLYTVDIYSTPARITPAYGQSWPSTREQVNSVTVRFAAGYGASGAAVPATIRTAMLQVIAHWYDNREAISRGQVYEVPYSATSLLKGYAEYGLCF